MRQPSALSVPAVSLIAAASDLIKNVQKHIHQRPYSLLSQPPLENQQPSNLNLKYTTFPGTISEWTSDRTWRHRRHWGPQQIKLNYWESIQKLLQVIFEYTHNIRSGWVVSSISMLCFCVVQYVNIIEMYNLGFKLRIHRSVQRVEPTV